MQGLDFSLQMSLGGVVVIVESAEREEPGDDQGAGAQVAAFDFGRILKVASCVAACLASSAQAGAQELPANLGGKHRTPG